MDSITCMRTFALVAGENSFTAAGKRLNMTTRLASKYVRQLEERLGAQLLNRTTRSVTLTDVGRTYLEKCLLLLEQFDELEAVVKDEQSELAGPIRVTAPTGFGAFKLTEALAPFLKDHPKVSVELTLSDKNLSIVDEGIDLAIRLSNLDDSSLIARKLRPMRVVVCASPDYLERYGEPTHPSALSTHNCLIVALSLKSGVWQFQDGGGELAVSVSGSFSSDAPRAVAEMAARGVGIARLPVYAAEPFLTSGRLQILFEQHETEGIGVYAVYPSKRHVTARVRALIEHLAERLSP